MASSYPADREQARRLVRWGVIMILLGLVILVVFAVALIFSGALERPVGLNASSERHQRPDIPPFTGGKEEPTESAAGWATDSS
jgi:hypothetical protein